MLSSILVAIIVISVLILVHELGHFIAARRAGLWVEEFGFGIPPRLWGKQIGETIYSINLFPFGGFVKIHGQNENQKILKPERAFFSKSKKTRASIVSAGIIANFLFGVLAFAIVYSFSGIPTETDNVRIIGISESSPAVEAGLLVGDVVRQVDEVGIESTDRFIEEVDLHKGERTKVIVEREEGGETIEKTIRVVPRADHPQDEGPLGIVITSSEIYFPPLWKRPFLGAYYGLKEALFWGKTIVIGVVNIFVELFSGHVPEGVAGPIGIFAVTSEAAKVGMLALINFVGILSINLAILNIIPFPALDGGVLLFIGLESIIGKKVLPRIESIIHNIGLIILLAILIAITFKDIRRLIENGGISGFIESYIK